jgi:hypothetical protein
MLHLFVTSGVRNYSHCMGLLTIMTSVDATKIGRCTVIVLKNETEYVEYIEAREAARMLGMSQRTVRNLAAKGRLETRRNGEGVAARLVVSTASIERLRSERQG